MGRAGSEGSFAAGFKSTAAEGLGVQAQNKPVLRTGGNRSPDRGPFYLGAPPCHAGRSVNTVTSGRTLKRTRSRWPTPRLM